MVLWNGKSACRPVLLFLLIDSRSGLLSGIWFLKFTENFSWSPFVELILVFVWTIGHCGQTLIFCTIPNGSPFLLSHAFSCIPFVCCSYYYCYNYFTPWKVFPTNCWVTASLSKSPGLFSVFWLFLIMLYSGWFPLIFLFPYLPVPLPILWDCSECTNYY